MAKISGKKITKEGQNSSRPPAKKYFKKLTNNKCKDDVHPSSVPQINPSENRALAPVNDNNATATNEEDEFSGYIFMCSGKTKPECYINRVFGLPSGRREVVEKIKPGTKLFLFDTEVKLLYGVYEATSKGGMNLEPTAFDGMFPAQVRFKIYKESLPVHLSSFRHAIKDNYQGSKFAPELNDQQVRALLSLYRPIDARSSGPPRYPTAPNGAPQLQMRPPPTYGAPEPQRIPTTNNGWVNGSLTTLLQNMYTHYNLPQQIVRPQLVQQNWLNPHLHHHRPADTHQAPPPPGHQPYLSYMMPEMHPPHNQTAGLGNGHREPVVNHVDRFIGQNCYPIQTAGFGSLHMQPTAPYGGPTYVHPPHTPSQGHEVVDRSLPVSSYYSFPGGLKSTR